MKDSINGIINIYKEAGFTSFDVVAKLRGITKQRKIGHTGTLDPDATGVLPVVLGNATRLVDMLTDKKKEYVAEFKLGITTDTQDISGSLLSTKEVNVSADQVRHAIESFVGDISQIPPMYSAIKVDGKRLYELAREGKEIERKSRPVTIHEIEIISIELPIVKMRVGCSKGTYIRTLCHDIGEKLGCGATMTSLVRTKSGQFSIDEAYKLSEVEEIVKSGRLNDIIVCPDSLFIKYRACRLNGEALRLAMNGNRLPLELVKDYFTDDGDESSLRVYDDNNDFFALYSYNSRKKEFIVDKMFL